MKILSIGNSFSQDAHRWLHDIAETDGYDLDTVNLYIGGCSLQTHWNNMVQDAADYQMEGNGGTFIQMTSLKAALESDQYDIITVQQVSGLSGKPQSYIPYITDLAGFVRSKQPDAKLYFHRTWSYETGSSHADFVNYNSDQQEMHRRLCDASEMAAKLINVPLIPVGNVIQSLREQAKEFDYQNGGLSLCRDGFHLSLDYGRFTAAAVWYKTLTGRDANVSGFAEKNKEFDPRLLCEIMEYVTLVSQT